jgi:hypothetical protein
MLGEISVLKLDTVLVLLVKILSSYISRSVAEMVKGFLFSLVSPAKGAPDGNEVGSEAGVLSEPLGPLDCAMVRLFPNTRQRINNLTNKRGLGIINAIKAIF